MNTAIIYLQLNPWFVKQTQIVAEYAYFSHQARTLKTDLLQVNNKFFYISFKNWHTLSPFLIFKHLFTALEFDSHYIGILFWKIEKRRDHNKTKPLTEEKFQKYKPIRHSLSCSFVSKVYDDCNKVTYLQKNKS